MSPEKVVIGNATLWLGDCMEVLPAIDRAAAIVSDPPYGIGYVHGGNIPRRGCGIGGGAITRGAKTKPIINDDREFDPAPLLGFSAVLLFGANHFARRLPSGGSWLVWDKSVGAGPADSFVDSELAWTSAPSVRRNVFRHEWKGLLADRTGEDLPGRNPNTWRRHHPSMKPVALMEWCIATAAGQSGMIVDPYMGAGTTGVAALRMGRKFVGVEMDREYFDIACERIERAQRQERLFA